MSKGFSILRNIILISLILICLGASRASALEPALSLDGFTAIQSGPSLPTLWRTIQQLQSQVASLQSQIDNIQLIPGPPGPQGPMGPQGPGCQPPAGSLHVIDANGADLGPVVGPLVYDPPGSVLTVVLWNAENSVQMNVNLETGLIFPRENFWFTSPDCTGTPYIEAYLNARWTYADGNYNLIMVTGTVPTVVSMLSKLDYEGHCVPGVGPVNVYECQRVTISNYPFAAPLRLEVR